MTDQTPSDSTAVLALDISDIRKLSKKKMPSMAAKYLPLLLLAQNACALNIFPLGDSLTQCTDPDTCYRRWLQALLHPDVAHKDLAANAAFLQTSDLASGGTRPAPVSVDFVGSMSSFYNFSNFAPPPPWFDWDHEGHWGWGVDELLVGCTRCPHVVRGQQWPSGRGKLSQWLMRNDGVGDDDGGVVDMALLHIGTNDLWMSGRTVQATIADVGQVLRTLLKSNPKMTIFLSQIIPCPVIPEKKRATYNSLLARLAVKDRVIIVNQHLGFNPVSDLQKDGVTPTKSGAQKIAQRFFNAMRRYLPSVPAGLSLGLDDVHRATATVEAGPKVVSVFAAEAHGKQGKRQQQFVVNGNSDGGSGNAANGDGDVPTDIMGRLGNGTEPILVGGSLDPRTVAVVRSHLHVLKDMAAMFILFTGACVTCTGAHVLDFVLAFMGFLIGGFVSILISMYAAVGTVHVTHDAMRHWLWLFLAAGFLGGLFTSFLVHRFRLFHLCSHVGLAVTFSITVIHTMVSDSNII